MNDSYFMINFIHVVFFSLSTFYVLFSNKFAISCRQMANVLNIYFSPFLDLFFIIVIPAYVRWKQFYLFTTQFRFLTTLKQKVFENIVGKGENAGNQHFLLLPQCFLLYLREKSSFQQHLFYRLQML